MMNDGFRGIVIRVIMLRVSGYWVSVISLEFLNLQFLYNNQCTDILLFPLCHSVGIQTYL